MVMDYDFQDAMDRNRDDWDRQVHGVGVADDDCDNCIALKREIQELRSHRDALHHRVTEAMGEMNRALEMEGLIRRDYDILAQRRGRVLAYLDRIDGEPPCPPCEKWVRKDVRHMLTTDPKEVATDDLDREGSDGGVEPTP